MSKVLFVSGMFMVLVDCILNPDIQIQTLEYPSSHLHK